MSIQSDIAIKLEGVSKKYCKSLKQSMLYGITDIGRNLIGLSSHSDRLRKNEFWAVNDVSFEVRKGENLGIIGPNGSGKTTILKMLNGIFWPDKGKVTVRGRTGALIEVGAGFHPLLTGRENVYLNGAILGMSKKEVDKKFDSIVEFADIGDFIDTPVKYYSSGMYVRLGFSVAVHSDPDILLVDEVLAVGDYAFQYKCISKMGEMKVKGVTIIFVSHNMTTVRGFCDRVILLDKGKIINEGNPEEVIKKYYMVSETKMPEGEGYSTLEPNLIMGKAEIIEASLADKGNNRKGEFFSGEASTFSVKIRFHEDINGLILGFQIFNRAGLYIYGVNTNWLHSETLRTRYKKGTTIYINFHQSLLLKPDVYYITFGLSDPTGKVFYDWESSFLKFRVVSDNYFEGIINLNSSEEIVKNE
jgi:ABC-type polysaccharide/polyol phosphate transport system ATPase subunit